MELLLLPVRWIFQRTVSNRQQSPAMRPMHSSLGVEREYQGPSGLSLGTFGTPGPGSRPKPVRRGSTSREFLFVVLRSTLEGTSDGVKRPFLCSTLLPPLVLSPYFSFAYERQMGLLQLLILPDFTERKYIEK